MGHKASSLKVYLSSFVLLVVGTCFAIRGDNCNTLTRTQTNKVESIASISRTTKDTAMPHTDYPPVLTFISCNHTVSPSLPSNLPLPLRPSYDHRTLLVSQPGNCLDCTIAFTKRNTTDVLVTSPVSCVTASTTTPAVLVLLQRTTSTMTLKPFVDMVRLRW